MYIAFRIACGTLVLDILRANRVPSEIHNISNSNIRHDVDHPECVVESRVVSWVAAVLQKLSWVAEVVLAEVAVGWHILYKADIVCAVLGAGLLPLPPEPIEVGVMEEEEWVSRAGAL